MPSRPCIRCGNLVPKGKSCECTPIRKAKTSRRGYDSKWRNLVAEAIASQPWCSDCGISQYEAQITGNPLSGDHIRWPAYSIDDIDVVCRKDNSRRGSLRASIKEYYEYQ